MGVNSYILVISVEIYKLKAEDLKKNAAPLCLGNISKYLLADNVITWILRGYVCDFSVDFESIYVADILDIHKF